MWHKKETRSGGASLRGHLPGLQWPTVHFFFRLPAFAGPLGLSGGDPFFQPEASLELAKHAKNKKLNVWAYSGFTFDQLLLASKEKPVIKELLENIDVLVDGKFILEKRSLELNFRGSTNQRIIDVKKSLKQNKVCSIKKYDKTKIKKTVYKNLYV